LLWIENRNVPPAYHHLDIAATLTPKQQRPPVKGEWVFSIYIYTRKMPLSIFRQNTDTGTNEAVNFDFGVVPAVSYNLKF
jgi:hypothetical protein